MILLLKAVVELKTGASCTVGLLTVMFIVYTDEYRLFASLSVNVMFRSVRPTRASAASTLDDYEAS